MNRAAFIASRRVGSSHWFADATSPRPAAKVLSISTIARVARDRAHQRGGTRAGTSSPSRMAAPSRRRSACARRLCRSGPAVRHRQLLGDAARLSRNADARSGGCRWSTSSPGSPMTRIRRCISPAGPEVAEARLRLVADLATDSRRKLQVESNRGKLWERNMTLVRHEGQGRRRHRLDARHRPRHRRAHGRARRQGRGLLAQGRRLR